MIPDAQIIDNNIINSSYSEQDSINALHTEIEKCVKSMKKGGVYTIEEAWEKINKI